jgi:hypothetical protein
VSSIFSACEQVEELTVSFALLGQSICEQSGTDVVVVPVDDLDKCNPELAVSLLLTLRNLMSGPFLFLVTLDRGIAAGYLRAVYGNAITADSAHALVQTVFDDWTDLPDPPLEKLLRPVGSMVYPGDPGQSEEFATIAGSWDVCSLVNTAAAMIRAAGRFEGFLRTMDQGATAPELAVQWFAWFLLATGHPAQTTSLRNALRGHDTQKAIEQQLVRIAATPSDTAVTETVDPQSNSGTQFHAPQLQRLIAVLRRNFTPTEIAAGFTAVTASL